jgi:uncharacterized protein
MLRSVFSLCFVLAFALFANAALAQQTPPVQPGAPLMGSEAVSAGPVAPAAAATSGSIFDANGTFRILVIGDALAGGLGAGMTRMAQEEPRFEIINRFNESSGLARTEVYDWAGALSKIVATKPVDAVVVLVGVNDRQEIRKSNIRQVFRAPEWVKGYTGNVDRLISAVHASQARLYWISVPPMADSVFDADMRFLSDLHRQRVAAAKGNYIDVRPFFLAPDGRFMDRGPDETGAERKLRDSDGVKFMKVGNNRFGQLVLGAIKTLEANGSVSVAAVEANTEQQKPVEPTPKAAVVAIEPPSFGQAGLDGESLVFRADTLTPPNAKVSSDQASVVQKNTNLPQNTEPGGKLSAKSGSASEKLIVKGLVTAAPAGRFDDFSAPVIAQ